MIGHSCSYDDLTFELENSEPNHRKEEKRTMSNEIRVACPEGIGFVWKFRGHIRGGVTGENLPGSWCPRRLGTQICSWISSMLFIGITENQPLYQLPARRSHLVSFECHVYSSRNDPWIVWMDAVQCPKTEGTIKIWNNYKSFADFNLFNVFLVNKRIIISSV